MYIQHIHIQNFRGIKEINLPLPATEKKQWIFLTGENGYGKTVFLQALALGLVGGKEHSHYNFYIDESENPTFDIKCISDLPEKEARKRILGYGYARLKKGETEAKEDWIRSRIYSLFRDNAVMQDIESEILSQIMLIFVEEHYHAVKNNQEHISIIKDKLILLLNKITNVYPSPLHIVNVKEGLLYNLEETNELIPFKKLSVGYKGILTLVGDIILKLEQDFNAEAIIFIDEFDAHLHPKWQREFVKKLSETFPNVQFVVATHSPIPILGCTEKPIVLNVKNDKEKGIHVERLDEWIDFEKLTPNTIFTSPAFDMENIFSEMSGEVFMSETYKEVLFRKVLNEKLVEYAEVDKGEKLNKLWKEGVE